MILFRMFMITIFIVISLEAQTSASILSSEQLKTGDLLLIAPSDVCILNEFGGGGIGMVDLAMIVYTDDPTNIILSVMVFDLEGNLVYSQQGCVKDRCIYDLECLDSGTYQAIAFTSKGTVIEDKIKRR